MALIEHWCKGEWQSGPVAGCAKHPRPGRALTLEPFAQRSNVTTEGVARTGQVSDRGTVSHREWFDGRVDGTARPRPVTLKLSTEER